jgi:hypothetical protein
VRLISPRRENGPMCFNLRIAHLPVCMQTLVTSFLPCRPIHEQGCTPLLHGVIQRPRCGVLPCMSQWVGECDAGANTAGRKQGLMRSRNPCCPKSVSNLGSSQATSYCDSLTAKLRGYSARSTE